MILTGGNTADACTLYDNDGDGNANLAVCVTTRDGGDPMTLAALRLYTCSDTRPDRCTGAMLVSNNQCVNGPNAGMTCDDYGDCDGGNPDGSCMPGPGVNTWCEVNQQSIDPFPAGDSYPTDSPATCLVELDDFGAGGSTASLTDACSYPSAQVNSDPSDCINRVMCTAASPPSTCDDGNPCTDDSCNLTTGFCSHVADATNTCGNPSDTDCDDPDTCSSLGFCEENHEPAGTVCRADAGQCDVAETCVGTGAACPADSFEPSTTACTGASNGGPCDAADHCSGTANTCVDVYQPSTTVCRADAGECDVAETCTGTSGACPPDSFESAGTACGSSSNTDCDNPDTCDGSGVCLSNNEAAGFGCTSDGNECTDDVCDGAGSCTHPNEPTGTTCGSSLDDECTDPDTCDGAGSCQSNHETDGTFCGDAGTECVVQDTCVGGACQDNGYVAAGTSCGSSLDDECTDPDTCDGAGSCQSNHEPTSTACTDTNTNDCLAAFCDGAGACDQAGEFEDEGYACGNGLDTTCTDPDTCDGAGTCLPNHAPTTTECRADAGECDVPEYCDGLGSCPADGFEPNGTSCGDGAETECTDPDTCDGSGNCHDNHEPTTTACTDTDENDCLTAFCDGSGDCDQAGEFESPGYACGDPSDTVCDNPDTCNASGTCLPNHEPTTFLCRADEGDCDVPENGDGVGNCPADAFEPVGRSCGDACINACTGADTCDGAGVCLSNNQPCGWVSDSSLCTYDVSSCLPGRPFNLLFTPDVQSWPAYKLNASNPGQTFYNLVVEDDDADGSVDIAITVPYPFVTQGARPLHVYDGDGTLTTCGPMSNLSCFDPGEALASEDVEIVIEDYSASEWPDFGPNITLTCYDAGGSCSDSGSMFGATCTLQYTVALPPSGMAYVNLHLDYGLKGGGVDANPCGSYADRYDRGATPSCAGTYAAMENVAPTLTPTDVAIPDNQPYTFGHVPQQGGDPAPPVYSMNTFKKIAGAFGMLSVAEEWGDGGGLYNKRVELWRGTTLLRTAFTDTDGFYLLQYKHTGRRAPYIVRAYSGTTCDVDPAGPSNLYWEQNIELKANGWAEANFRHDPDPEDDGPWDADGDTCWESTETTL